MSVLLGLVTSCDIFGQGIQLRINNSPKAKTFLGGVLSTLLISSIFAMFLISAQDVFHKINPYISTELQFLEKTTPIHFNKEGMVIATSVTDESVVPVKVDKYFSYQIIRRFGATNSFNLNLEKIGVKNCTRELFKNLPKEKFEEIGIYKQLCFDKDNVTITGNWNEDYIEYLEIRLVMCKNSTENNNFCAPREQIKAFLSSGMEYYFNLYILDSVINPHNYEEPITYRIVNLYSRIIFDRRKITQVFVKQQTINSDEGFIFPTIYTNSSFTIDKTDFDNGEFYNDALIEFHIICSETEVFFHREYKKIQEILARIGGLANVGIIIFTLICYTFSVVKRDISIQNKIFDYDLNEKVDNQQDILSIYPNQLNYPITQIKSFELSSISGRSFSNLNSNNISNNNTDVKIIRRKRNKSFVKTPDISQKNPSFTLNNLDVTMNNAQSLQIIPETNDFDAKKILSLLSSRQKKYELNFSFCEIISAFLCCKCCWSKKLKLKKTLYSKSNFIVEEFLDITNIIQKLDEFEKLKIVLLNQDQLALFNFITKEFISLDGSKVANHSMTIFKQLNKDKEHLANLIFEFKKKLSMTREVKEIDLKLYNLLNDVFK